MKSFTPILALASIAAAAPLTSRAETQEIQYLNVMSIRSASAIMYQPWVARGQKIYLGGNTASYCPDVVSQQGGTCPPGNRTNFVGGNGGLSMGTVVPGGQQVYIDGCTGALGYTQAHSAAIPEGAITDGWSVKEGVAAEGVLGELSWTNGLLGCPTDDSKTSYQVFADVEGVDFSDDCLGFDALFSNSSSPDAWQYT